MKSKLKHKWLCRSAVLWLGVAFGGLGAAPDPDIFDGRVPPPPAERTPDAAHDAAGEPASRDELPDAGANLPPEPPAAGEAAAGEEPPAPSGEAEAPAEGEGTDAGEAGEQGDVSEDGDAVAEASGRSFEGLDEIGGVPVAHPGAEPVDSAEADAEAERMRSAGVGTPEATGTGGGEPDGGHASEERSFDDLQVGGSASRDRQVEVQRSRETRPEPSRPAPTGPQRGTGSSPQDEQAGADQGTDVPEGL